MLYKEVEGDLFELGKGSYLVHCISSDFALGAGIAVKFRQMGVADSLNEDYFFTRNIFEKGYCLYTTACKNDNIYKGVFNLVTKHKYFNKPTYQSMQEALTSLKANIESLNIKSASLYMPLIGCGLDRLRWDKVSDMIKSTFSDCDIEIVVCKYGR